MFDFCVQLTVLQGDIVRVSADAIVHPTNSTYHMGGEVGKESNNMQSLDSLLAFLIMFIFPVK